MTPDELKNNIDTIAVVILENRSFDHLLGYLRLPEFGGRQDIEGTKALDDPALINNSQNGTGQSPFISDDAPFTNDLPHERNFVEIQLAWANAINRFAMNGFVLAYEQFTGTSGRDNNFVMGVLTPPRLPISSFLAQEYLVADHWHAPLPASTQPNRLMAMSGDTLRDYTQAGLLTSQKLVYDWLDDHGVPWRAYVSGLPFFTLMPSVWPRLLDRNKFRDLHQLSFDVQHDDNWPKVIFIEPDYDDSPVHLSGHACDNHPPLPLAFGEIFLQKVYQALTARKDRWNKTVLIITYDEHGGFFDHVQPVRIPYAKPANATFTDPDFETTGVRVPSFIVSPWVGRGSASHLLMDHTSILQLIAERFGRAGEDYSPSVRQRKDAGINSVSAALDAATPARDVIPQPKPASIQATVNISTAPSNPNPTDNQLAFAAAAKAILDQHGQDAKQAYPELAHLAATG